MNTDILLALHETPGIGWKTIAQLVHILPSTQLDDWSVMKQRDWLRCGIKESVAQKLPQALTASHIEHIKERMAKRRIDILTRLDSDYPPLLQQIHQPPWVLYLKGRRHLLQNPAIAMVGTRKPTYYGRKTTAELAQHLSAAGLTVVSGLAKGIDTAAHRGALLEPSSSIAVLGTGLDRVYPSENIKLAQQMAQTGLLLTEYPLGTPIHPGLFPMRNRIIAGMTHGTVVVEAAKKSGSLITADLALEENRDVYAVPGPIHSVQSQGTLSLIQQGAMAVMCAEDIIRAYEHLLPRQLPASESQTETIQTLDADERQVLQFLSEDPVTLDELMLATKLNFGHLHSVLLHLHMKNKVECLPGSRYISK